MLCKTMDNEEEGTGSLRHFVTRAQEGGGPMPNSHCIYVIFFMQDQSSYVQFMRMKPELFDMLETLTTPYLQKKKSSISPGMRLALTLRFLATGTGI